MVVQLRYQFRVYPTPGQQIELTKAFGCARVVFNDGLRLRRQAHEAGEKYISDADLSKLVITKAKGTEGRAWLGEVSSVVLQQALADLNTAYRNFFTSLSGKRKGRRVAPPRYRSRKDNRQAIRFTRNSRFKVLDNGRLRLAKIGDVPVNWSRSLPSEPSSVTVIKDAAGRYFASFVVTTVADEVLPPVNSEIGIDLGLTHFAVMSDGTKVTAPKFLRRAARRLKRLQQDLSRKAKGSNRRKKAVVKVARAHARVADTRRDWQHKLSTQIIRDNQAVYVEDLAVAGPGWPRVFMTPAGPASPACWSTRPHGAGGRLAGWTGSCRPLGCARTAHASTRRWRSTFGRGTAPAAVTTTGTSTPPSTSRPPGRRTSTTVERR